MKFLLPVFLIFFAVYSSIVIIQTTQRTGAARDNHLVLLAEQLAHGNIALSPLGLPQGDYVDYFGRQYLYFGPVASVVLMPLAAIYGRTFPQIWLGIFSLSLSFFAVFVFVRCFRFEISDALWLAIFFVFSTVLFSVGVINLSVYQVQALGVALVLLALVEYFCKKRFLVIGIFIALAGLTRMTLYLSLIFFLLESLKQKVKFQSLVLLLIPIILSLTLLGAYNYKRFRSPWETGYRYNITLKFWPMSVNLSRGFFSLDHLPANLYSLLIKSPEPVLEQGGGFVLKFPYIKVDPWGMAIWFNSPLLLLLFKLKREQLSYSALITTGVLMAPSLLYFGIGFSQFGYRYSLDFLPFLFLLLLPVLKPKLGLLPKALIFIGVLFNGLYMTSIW